MSRLLFILKARPAAPCHDATPDCPYTSGIPTSGILSSGLDNAARFLQDMLTRQHHAASVAHAIDNDCIDRLVSECQPDIVILEAYWVVPEKFAVLSALHPNVRWIVRNHSAVPFLATDGIAMDWSLRYMNYPGVALACNDERPYGELRAMIASAHPQWTQRMLAQRVMLLPNYYPAMVRTRSRPPQSGTLAVGCFGAIRPLKNQLLQAVAAVQYADSLGRSLHFHVNAAANDSDPVLHNLRGLFAHLPHHLVEHAWMPHAEFLTLLRGMDLSLQVSYSETFNIVSADAITNDVPVVTSAEMRWISPAFHADPNCSRDMVRVMRRAHRHSRTRLAWRANLAGLTLYNHRSVTLWRRMIGRQQKDPPKRVFSGLRSGLQGWIGRWLSWRKTRSAPAPQ